MNEALHNAAEILGGTSYIALTAALALVVFRRHRDLFIHPWFFVALALVLIATAVDRIMESMASMTGGPHWQLHLAVDVLSALIAFATAVMFIWMLPRLLSLPSPHQQRLILQNKIYERTAQINHRVGNQLQVILSFTNIERRRATEPESTEILNRLGAILAVMSSEHHRLSSRDYEE